MNLSELFERFMAQKKAAGLETTTLARYQNLFDCHLIPALGKKKIKELKQGYLVSQYAQWLKGSETKRALSARTVRHVHETLRNALGYAVRMEYVHRNVAALISSNDLPKAVKPKPKGLTETELTKLPTEAKCPSVVRRSEVTYRLSRGSIQQCFSQLTRVAVVARYSRFGGVTYPSKATRLQSHGH